MRNFYTIATALTVVFTSTAGVPTTAMGAEYELEEILVTAQRREQKLQEVPITVSTMSGERLDDVLAAGEDIRALATRIPSLYAESSNGRVAPRFYIRGLGNTDFDLAASQPVSVVVDEVVKENVILKSFPLFDVERVEVLKGPQGTLFGRNTPAGIVKIDTVKPSYELDGYASLSYAPDDAETTIFEGAIGGPLIDDVLAGRLSLLYQDRDDWIDNGFTGQGEALGGFEETAARAQLLWNPTDRLSFLVSGHYRDLDGTASVFRANIIGPGKSHLNTNFDRETVFFDQGANNPQSYDGGGGTLRIDYDFDLFTVTSITAYEETDGSSLGDIDGGSGAGPAADPPPIPFPAVTRDGLDDLDQFSQEIRLSHEGTKLNWQGGFFYFDTDYTIATNPFFAPTTLIQQEDESWAVFGQASYDFLDWLNVTAGIRYTDDDKTLTPKVTNQPVPKVDTDDNEVSWDLAALVRVNEDMNLFARIARGYRAPSIQGRDIAFFGQPSVAKSETILSFETGIKSTMLDNRFRINASVFYYKIDDQQLTAVGGASNLVQLVNADEGEGRGYEIDVEWLAAENLAFTFGYSYNDTEIQDNNLTVQPCGSGICTVTDALDANGNALVNNNSFPQAPSSIFYATASASYPIGDGGELFGFADYAYQGRTNMFIYSAQEFEIDKNWELGLRGGYRRQNGRWEVSVFGRNVTDEENIKGAIDFNNNTGFVNEPMVWGANLKVALGM